MIHWLFSHSEKLCEDHGSSFEWTTGQEPQLIKDGRRIKCNTANYVPIIVPGLSTSSSSSVTPTSPASVWQEAVHPASTRSESSSSAVWGSPSHEPEEIEKTKKNGDDENVRGNPLLHLPEWLEEFPENLVDESVPAHKDAPACSLGSREDEER